MSALPQDIAAAIAARGARFDAEVLAATRALFAPLQDLQLPSEGGVHEALAYGGAERQRLDAYLPGKRGAPVLVYVCGGGFVGGDRRGYRNVGAYFARHGYLTLIPDYRLAPADSWPAGAQDVAAVVDFAAAEAAKHGGDPARIFVVAQSAGATHAAGALFDSSLQPKALDAVRKAVLVNGIYAVAAGERAPNLLQYFGEDATEYERRSPITHVAGNRLPVLLMLAEYDPAFLASPTLEFARALCLRDGKAPPLVWLAAHNHLSPIMAIGTPHDAVGPRVLEFLGR